MRGRKSVKAEKRKQILELAKKVFAKYGFAKTTMEDIADELGLTAAAFYYYFDSKDHLFKECVADELSKVVERIEEEIKNVSDPVEKLKRYIEVKIQAMKDVAGKLNMSKEILEEFKGEVSKLGLKDIASRENRIIEEIIRRGVEENKFRSVDVKRATFVINVIVKELISTEDRKKEIEEVIDILLRGIQKQSG